MATQNDRYTRFLSLIAVLIGAILACNYSGLTPTPSPTSPQATPSSTRGPGTPTTTETTPTPGETPPVVATTAAPTTSPCVDQATSRTQGCDEFTRQLDAVRRYDRLGVPQAACRGWCQLKEGDILETDNTGQAELNFSDCWPGRLYLFQTSVAQAMVSVCTKADFCPGGNCGNPPAVCVPNGAVYADQCASEFNPVSGSIRIEKTSASYLITYQKEAGDVSMVVVMDGAVRLRPVARYDPVRLGELVEVRSGQFIFTMPDESLRGVGGLEPRVVHSVELLPQVVQELGLQDWVIQAAEKAQDGGYLPENWPTELLRRGLVVRAGGGRLADLETQIWLYRAINWDDLPVSDQGIRIALREETIDAGEIRFLPERAATVLKTQQLLVQIVFPANDGELEKTAAAIAAYLQRAGVETELTPVEPGQLAALVKALEEKGQPYLLLTR